MNYNKYFISIIVNCHNGEKYVNRCIERRKKSCQLLQHRLRKKIKIRSPTILLRSYVERRVDYCCNKVWKEEKENRLTFCLDLLNVCLKERKNSREYKSS